MASRLNSHRSVVHSTKPQTRVWQRGLFILALLPLSLSAQDNGQPTAAPQTDDHTQLLQLREAVRELQSQLADLKRELRQQRSADERPADNTPAFLQSATPAALPVAMSLPSADLQAVSSAESNVPPETTPLDFLRQTSIALGFDGYYGYNFNDPIGRVNLLRAYDVSSNAFSLNQANIILKQDPDPSAGRRYGARLDLQFGQATETLQGNSGNEPRPDVYRNVFQAYGTYVFPAGNGLTVDMGKFASSLGYENNYSKDQMNYSRSFWFNFLPFYHMGVRANYKFNDEFAVNYWVVNGTQQTEPFNGFKDQFFGAVLTPAKTVSWTINYYLGQEHPDVVFFPNGGAPPNSPTEQGLPFQPIPDAPNGRLHIFDTYVSWQSTPQLTFAVEGDYVIERLSQESVPAHVDGGAAYLQYRFTPKTAFASRAEYLSDRGGLFSGKTQALKEVTLTLSHKLAGGFLVQTEFRRDFSNMPEFLTDQLGILSGHQTTATMGLIWWWGNHKDEAW